MIFDVRLFPRLSMMMLRSANENASDVWNYSDDIDSDDN